MKPSLAKGTRDFMAQEVAKRRYVMEILQRHFEVFGFSPLETPSFENIDTLMGKYGEEGDRLIFKILKSGDFLENVSDATAPKISEISDKALRYDLTVPFARFVAQNQGKIPMPFKRYQIQPVWRADRPQRGRFREFYQCDADVVGSKSLWQEVELVDLYTEVFSSLGLPVLIRLNNRKILAGIADVVGLGEHLVAFTVAVDKLDKVGVDGVLRELAEKGIAEEALQRIEPLLVSKRTSEETLSFLSTFLSGHTLGLEGLSEMKFILEHCAHPSHISLDLTLARGLNYYTGSIFEVTAQGVSMGSVGGGGRYDDLTSIFGLKGVSGVGISFGLDRIILCLEEQNAFPAQVFQKGPMVLFLHPEQDASLVYSTVRALRKRGLSVEFYPEPAKVKRQYEWANLLNIQWVVQEVLDNGASMQWKNVITGEVSVGSVEDFIKLF